MFICLCILIKVRESLKLEILLFIDWFLKFRENNFLKFLEYKVRIWLEIVFKIYLRINIFFIERLI